MNKETFFIEIKDVLEIEGDVDENTAIYLSSIGVLSAIAFIDENFDKQVKTSDLKGISTIIDLMSLIGLEHFK